MDSIDPGIAASTLPLWIAAAAGFALVVAACLLAFRTPPTELLASLARSVLLGLAALTCGSLIWAFIGAANWRDELAQRRALEARADHLAAQALAPGSPLACLDALVGDAVATACQKAVFASPASVAAATSYVAAQFALLSDMTAYTRAGGEGLDRPITSLQRALEADPFGFLAHMLALRDACTAAACPALGLLHQPSQVRTNLIAQTLDHYVDQYREAWAKSPNTAAGVVAEVQPNFAPDATAPERRKVKLSVDFPSAASIPAISIMNPEPKAPAGHDNAGGAGAPAKGTAPAPGSSAARTDPVWLPAPAPAPVGAPVSLQPKQ